MRFLVSLCVLLLLLINDKFISGQWTDVLSYDPCDRYTVLDEPWRATSHRYASNLMCDASVNWSGWYRFFIRGVSVNMPDTCVEDLSCGTHAPLWLNGQHPRVEDGVVTLQVCGNWNNDCCFFQTSPIRVKACPGNYYVYELVSPWFCYGTYCADDRSLNIPTVSPGTNLPASLIADPCHSYTELDEPWRSTSQSFSFMCDSYVSWSGWYRLFINGESAQMPNTCVSEFSCGTAAPLWLKGPHPRVEDGVVRRHVCGNWNNDCCHFEFSPLKVKACPGNYYVYEFVSPTFCFTTYCAELSGTQDTMPSVSPITPNPDPCSDYHIIDDFWRDITQYQYQSYGQDDLLLDWNGWYRLYLNGRSAQMSEWCVTHTTGCGGDTGLYLDGTHPRLEDGVVTRDVLGTYVWYPYQCGNYRSNPIKVKACPGDYYVYKLVKPDASIPRPTYCTVAFNAISNDPCYDYKSLDRPWRASYESGLTICDELFSWNGWYRLFHNGMDIRMSESCVSQGSCNTNVGLSLNGPHPEIGDGVVTRQVCGDEGNGCCSYKSTPIRVKACPGNYYVYEIAKPTQFCSGYCTDVNTVSQPVAPTPPTAGPLITFNNDYDPCYNHNNLDDYWRSALNNRQVYGQISGNDDTLVEWNGWYRLLLNGQSAQMPEWCATYMSCGGFSSLWLGGSHPQLEDGVVTREVYGTQNDQCSYYTSNPIEVKACDGDFHVYKFVKPSQLIPVPVYCAVPFNTPIDDPCYNYNSLDDPWRASNFFDPSYSEYCDYNMDWNGWYRLFNYGEDAQMPESCVHENACGSRYPLWLNGPHPQLEDGVVTRQVCSPTWDDCCGYKSIPIQVKACPGNYYIYEFVRPPYCGAYCADRPSLHTTAPVTMAPPTSITVPAEDFDPCYNYTVLDEPWRATNIRYATITCDAYVSWSGWYRLFIYGQSVRMPETCVADFSCGTHAPLWLNGPHPSVEDGVVTRDVCGNWVGNCCYFRSNPIKVKACPGNYYVYEFVSPNFCYGTYCADVSTINTNYAPTTTPIVTSSSDPCSNYNVLDDYWRDIHDIQLAYNSYGYDDRFVEWNGWYRLFVKGESAQMSEWCTRYTGCGGDTGLYLKGSHPRLEDGVVTREVSGSYVWSYQCDSYTSTPIQVKACPGDYYVYNLVKPDMSIPRPSYCTVAFKNTSNDPCYNYESLDRPWRASNERGVYVCDEYYSWNGWYRLFHNGMNIRMSENCVTSGCNAYHDLWLNGPHPQIEDGVVTREVCVGSYWGDCCTYSFPPVRVKACPGNYYVYELTEPLQYWCAGYCTDVNSISQVSFTTPASVTGSMMTLPDSSVDYDPCYNYNIQDNYWRSTLNNWYTYGYITENDDTRVKWSGWYRLFINGQSAQMPEWCAAYMLCGGFSSLWLGGSHPQLEDGVVTREVYGTLYDQCNYFRSNSIQVKACPGDYYVYKLIRPNLSIPAPTYCAVAFPTPRDDPCFSYTSLDEPQRATNYPYYDKYYSPMCDYNVNWNGWYRLFYNGRSAQMSESCVGFGMCGTYYPLYLGDHHPQLEDGVVTRQVCISSWNGCCAYKSHPIQVKACPGNYYVYEFVRPIFCSAYCTDFSNTFITATNSSISPGPFYPFGTEDTENERSDDGSSPMISLTQPFTFFDQIYNQVYVNNNGYLTFDWEGNYYYPFQFPAHSGRDIIAPFWTDIDNRGNGVISYSQYTSGDVLTMATQDINQYFPDLTFTATWVFVATWDRVAYYSYSGTETSFQVVLISDGLFSFVLMNYGEIAPTQRYVQAGIDTHDSSNLFSISESLSNNITSLTYSSNVNVPGRWAFRIDYGPRSCQFNDVPVQLGNSFWTDATCQQRCTCTLGGLECSWDPCTYSQACRPAAFQYSCQNIERQTCTVSGDPHYYTFDYQVFHFQGTCTYVLSEACGSNLPYYRIEGKNDHRGSTHVSWTRMVRVFVYDEVIELVKDHYYEAKVNGSFAATPFFLRDGSIQVFWSGFSVVISTDFGLLVTYDAYHYVTISVPFDYYNSTCGLCGNFNLNPEDDFRSPDEKVLSSDVDFANSWKVESDPDPECHNVKCTGLGCADCTADEMNVYSDIYHCGILGDAAGPFAPCHSAISPQTYIENCVYDLCLGGGYQPILCQALNVYATQCQQQGVQLGQWRQTGFCEIICSIEYSHFEAQGTGCPATCSNPSAPTNCPLPNQESCVCNAGYIFSAGACVPEANCGCTFEGFYYAEGQSVMLDDDCGRTCICSGRSMTCIYHQCGSAEECGVHNGVRGCRPTSYATCSVENLGSYHTFDGQTFRYPGACGLTLARVMGPSPLPHFVLTVEKVPRGLEDFSRVLKFEAEGIQVSIEMGEGSNVQVDGQMVGLPISVGSGQIHIYHSSVRGFVLETNFGVTVRADWPHIVKITAPSTYNSMLGGLCGNLNGNVDDEFYSPDGVLLDDPQLFAESWRDGSLSVYCEDPIDSWESGHYQNSSQFFDLCHIMMMDDGPFAECSATLDPSQRIQDCIWMLEQTGGAGEALCEALRSYTLLCQQNGFAVEEWRSVTNCDPTCPPNSHYELCGTSCPAACPGLSFPFHCSLLCQEGCQCNDGQVLNGDRCVPPTGCGCHYNGRYRQPGEQFWHSEECQSHCVCDGITGNVHCTASACSEQEICQIVEGEYGCHPQPHGSCSASGDPHYISFDGTVFDFQGTCRYVLATVCDQSRGLPHFQVEGRNEPWQGLPVSITVEVFVNVSGHLVHMSLDQNLYASVEVDGETRNLPVLLDSGRVSVYNTGQFLIVSTDTGFSVTYGSLWVVNIIVPAVYSGATCGICGNFNGHLYDDFMLRSGDLASSADQFGADWKVEDDLTCNHGCGNNCPLCQDQTTAEALCDIIRTSHGPFSFCHAYVDPQTYFNDCVFDVCISENNNDVLCHSIQSYVSACQYSNAHIYPWRQNTVCGMICSNNSHYELCGTDCGHTCASSIDASCQHTCSEGCFCDDGFVRSGQLCVPVEQCGCLYNGFYYHIGDQFRDSECSQLCECFAPNDLRCSASSCPSSTECTVRNGLRGCYSQMSTCAVWGDPHYVTFDGALAHFQGTCSYEIANTCGNANNDGLAFRVVATNRHRGNQMVSFVSVVDVWLSQYGVQTHITIDQNRRISVNGQPWDSPSFQIDDLVEVHEEQGFMILNALNEFMVHFDGHNTLLIRLSQSFYGALCGMCGNYNDDPADDKVMPGGVTAPDDFTFGHSWISNISSNGCGATDRMGNADGCKSEQEYSELCSIISSTTGPFQQCHLHVDPTPYYSSCVYDLCLSTPANGMLCSAVEGYEAACAVMGILISEWRSSVHCPAIDPCSELGCTENEWCGEHHGFYGCFCNEDIPRNNPDTFDSFETCESSTGSMSLSRCQLFEAGFPADNLHLNDFSCRGTVQNGRVDFTFDNSDHICGTSLTANGTHIIYENYITGQPDSPDGLISRKKILQLHFSCTYHQTQTVSMDINPVESVLNRHIQGEGKYQVRMLPYQDVEFSNPFNSKVEVVVDQEIFVEVRVDGVDSNQFASVIDSCWATPVNDPLSSLRWDLIIEECANPNDDTVKLLQNGLSTSSRFSFKMFIFTANSTKVYLHCNIHLCLMANNDCSAHCYPGHHMRVGRSLAFHDTASISMGPLVLSKRNSDILASQQVKSGAQGLCGSLILLLVLCTSFYTIF